MSLYLPLAELAEVLAATGSKLKKRALIADALTAVREDGGLHDAGLFALYLAGTPFAEADARKLNIGGALMSRAVRAVTEPTDAEFTAAYRRHGDLGAAAGDLWVVAPTVAAATLQFATIQEAFAAIAVAKTTAVRGQLLLELLRAATPVEAKYLVKLMLGDMRIGVKQALIEEAAAVAAGQDVAALRHAVMLEADLAEAVRMAFEGRLADARMRLFHPLGFMLASPVETPEEAVKRFAAKPDASDGEATSLHIEAQIEDKFDGMRVQLHCADPAQPDRAVLYSRNREDVSASWPEITEAFAGVDLSTDIEASQGGLILDGELLAWDVTSKRALPFAVLSPRLGRKRVTDEIRRGVPAVFMAFDLMCQNGELLLDLPLQERRNRLEAVVERLQRQTLSPLEAPAAAARGGLFDNGRKVERSGEQRLILSAVSLAESAEDLDRAYAAARDRGNEGVMIKASASLYQPGRRGISWVKLKRHLDTLDVVITGAEYGSGRKSQVLSDYTFAVRAADGSLQNVGKAYSGVTDAEIAELTEWLKAHTLEDYGHYRTVEPLMVLEVAFNNIMRSDRHASGFALRFPRILQIRRDKPLEEIDTVARVEEIYQSQPDRPVETLG